MGSLKITPSGKMAMVNSDKPLKGFSDFQLIGDTLPDEYIYIIPVEKLGEAKRKGAELCDWRDAE